MDIAVTHVNAFAEQPFDGAHVCVSQLARWLPDETLAAIAAELGAETTAYVVGSERERRQLRWFSPRGEICLAAGATLAAAYVAASHGSIAFESRAGHLALQRVDDDTWRLDLPSAVPTLSPKLNMLRESAGIAVNLPPPDVLRGGEYLMAVYEDAAMVAAAEPGPMLEPVLAAAGSIGLIVTAPGGRADMSNGGACDFTARLFRLESGGEAPASGLAFRALVPYWSKRLGRPLLRGGQVSTRGTVVPCSDRGAHVTIEGRCRTLGTTNWSV